MAAAREALAWYRQSLAENPGDWLARMHAAEVAVLLREYETAVTLLESAEAARTDFAAALSNVYVAWWDARSAGEVDRPAEEHPLELLERAIDSNPHNPAIWNRLEAFHGSSQAEVDRAPGLLAKFAR